jgi:hypothetical protein
MSLQLDPRIKDIPYIADCFTTDNYKEYVDTECYMTDFIDRFRDLSLCKKAVLTRIADGLDAPYVSGEDYFKFCLASVFVEEQKQTGLRPLTLREFKEKFFFGEYITFRRKDRTRYFCTPFNGHEYRSEIEDHPHYDAVHLGAYSFSLQDLFDDYELKVGDGWKPFGVEKNEVR